MTMVLFLSSSLIIINHYSFNHPQAVLHVGHEGDEAAAGPRAQMVLRQQGHAQHAGESAALLLLTLLLTPTTRTCSTCRCVVRW